VHSVAFISGILGVAIWVYLLTAHGGFWRVASLQAKVRPLNSIEGIVAVVIPARDEAEVIGTTVQSLLKQSCGDAIRIFVVDDHSSDGTADAARQAAESCGRSEALSLIHGIALPAGWTGKLWAVRQGVVQAAQLNPQFLLLTDADIRHSPESIATLVAIAEAENYDLTSFMVRLHCRSMPERFLIPPFVFFFFLLYPPNWIRNPQRKVAGAAGGCMLIRPRALERAGGVAAI